MIHGAYPERVIRRTYPERRDYPDAMIRADFAIANVRRHLERLQDGRSAIVTRAGDIYVNGRPLEGGPL